MTYYCVYSKRSIKDLKKISKKDGVLIQKWIENKIDNCDNPRRYGINLLSVKKGWRYRNGNYRIVVQIIDEDKLVKIYRIGKREDIYKKIRKQF